MTDGGEFYLGWSLQTAREREKKKKNREVSRGSLDLRDEKKSGADRIDRITQKIDNERLQDWNKVARDHTGGADFIRDRQFRGDDFEPRFIRKVFPRPLRKLVKIASSYSL